MIPLIGFAPDTDPTTPGVIVQCANLIPSEGGMKGAPSPVNIGADVLAMPCVGAAATSDLSGNRRLIVGTSSKLYELSGFSWSDISRGGNYSLGADDRWSYIQFANATLAANPSNVIQRSTSGAFANIAGSPQAKMIEAAQGFALAFNTTTSSDEWYCSEYLNESGWTLNVTTQCVKGRLIGGSGPITAARRFGEDVIAYKAGTLFVGRYVGAPEVWRWTQASNDVGCIGQDAVVDTSIGHVFMGKDNVYLWDGTTPRPLATGSIRRWLFADMNQTYRYKTILLWDRPNHLVWIYYPSAGGGGVIDHCAVYHVLEQKWGLAHSTIQAAVTYTSPTFTYDSGTSLIPTYDTGKGIPYDSLFWLSGTSNPSVFTSLSQLSTLSGGCTSASFTTGDMGDDEGYKACLNFRVRYTEAPTTSTATGYVKDASGDVVQGGEPSVMFDGRHNMRQNARWHRFKVDTVGDFTVTAVRPEFVQMGQR